MNNDNLRTQLADAKARRAAIIDGVSMGDPRAQCMACRARGLLLAGLLLAGVGYLVARPPRGGAE